jgi:hypothetical protein
MYFSGIWLHFVEVLLEGLALLVITVIPDAYARCVGGRKESKVKLRGLLASLAAYVGINLVCLQTGVSFRDRVSGGAFAIMTGAMVNRLSSEE